MKVTEGSGGERTGSIGGILRLETCSKSMPNSMPNTCIDGLTQSHKLLFPKSCKYEKMLLSVSQCKLLTYREAMIRNQQVAGSSPAGGSTLTH